jgi:VWFA-related protein
VVREKGMSELKTMTTTLLILVGFFSMVAAKIYSQDSGENISIKIRTVLLNIPVVVSDKHGRSVSSLTKEDFLITQNGEKQNIEYLIAASEPITVAFIIDASASTAYVLEDIKRAARSFVGNMSDEDKGMVISFADHVSVLSKLTVDKKELSDSMKYIRTLGEDGSNMYDAIHRVLTKDFENVRGRKAIIVLTDGDVHGRKVTRKMLKDALVESDAFVYPIYYQTGSVRKIEIVTMNELKKRPHVDFLDEMAILTGGRLFAAGLENFQGAFQQITEDLKKYYVVGFYPTDEGASSNNIQIKVNRDDVIVRTKHTIRLKAPATEIKK